MAFPQCPKCFDNLSKLVALPVPMADYPDGLCVVCAAPLEAAARAMAEPYRDGFDGLTEPPAREYFTQEVAPSGATLRDRFAAHCLTAFVEIVHGKTPAECYDRAADHAYLMADAMIRRRAK